MRKIHFLNFLLLITTISSCQNNLKKNSNQENTIKENPECEILYNKYIEKFSIRENDSALHYIDKSINCDPANIDYKYYKVQFLIATKEFKTAILILQGLSSDIKDPTLKMQIGILKLKIKDADSKSILETCYGEFKEIDKPTSSNLFYKIALDNYFKGKEFSLNRIKEFKEAYKDRPYETQNITALQEMIKNESKEKVLFNLFNIKD